MTDVVIGPAAAVMLTPVGGNLVSVGNEVGGADREDQGPAGPRRCQVDSNHGGVSSGWSMVVIRRRICCEVVCWSMGWMRAIRVAGVPASRSWTTFVIRPTGATLGLVAANPAASSSGDRSIVNRRDTLALPFELTNSVYGFWCCIILAR